MTGRWADAKTAERKYLAWIGEHSGVEGARIELAEQSGDGWRVLKSWPDDEAGRVVSAPS